MAVTANWYARAFLSLANKEVDLVGGTDDTYAALTSGYTPNQDTHDYWNDVVSTELANGNGYTTNGYQMTGEAFTQTLNALMWDADNPQWTTATLTTDKLVYVDRTPATDATRPLISWVNFGGNQTVNAGTLEILHAAGGIATMTAADATGFP